jgi:hypothetical protein
VDRSTRVTQRSLPVVSRINSRSRVANSWPERRGERKERVGSPSRQVSRIGDPASVSSRVPISLRSGGFSSRALGVSLIPRDIRARGRRSSARIPRAFRRLERGQVAGRSPPLERCERSRSGQREPTSEVRWPSCVPCAFVAARRRNVSWR